MYNEPEIDEYALDEAYTTYIELNCKCSNGECDCMSMDEWINYTLEAIASRYDNYDPEELMA